MKILGIFLFAGTCLATGLFGQEKKAGYFTSFDSTRIYYEVRGKGFPVLLIHGFMNNGDDWKKIPLYDQLPANGYMVITVDLRGNGKSGKPHTAEAYANDAEAKDLIGLMNFLGIKRYALVGYSRGSIIGARLLVMDKHVRTAVLGGMGADFTNPNWPRRIAFYEALMYDTIPGFEGVRKRIADNGLDKLALAYQQKGQPSTSKEELGKVKKRVMVVCGDKDQDNGNGADLAKLIPSAIYVTVPGNHGSAWHSSEFTAEIMGFLLKQQ
jgi:pimeloyl-ACP methyl ester carboxylesterase